MDSQEYQRRKREELDLLVCDAVDGRLEIKAQHQHRGCPYCDSTDSLHYSNEDLSKGLSYVRCRTCRLVYPLPRLGQEALDTRVDSPILNEYYQGSVQGPRVEEDNTEVRVSFRRELDFLRKYCTLDAARKFRVLEVGCADGRFLKALAALGCRVTGVEPNATSAQFARGQGLDIVHGFFRPGLPLSSGDYDLIVFRDSLYHLFDVRQVLDLSNELLVADGSIYIKCFNVDSYAIQTFASGSGGINGLDIPCNFSPKSLRYMLRDSGFEVSGTLYLPEQ